MCSGGWWYSAWPGWVPNKSPVPLNRSYPDYFHINHIISKLSARLYFWFLWWFSSRYNLFLTATLFAAFIHGFCDGTRHSTCISGLKVWLVCMHVLSANFSFCKKPRRNWIQQAWRQPLKQWLLFTAQLIPIDSHQLPHWQSGEW